MHYTWSLSLNISEPCGNNRQVHRQQVLGPTRLGSAVIQNLPANTRDVGMIPGSERSSGERNGTHSSILAWKIPWTEEPGGLQSMGSQRVRPDTVTERSACQNEPWWITWPPPLPPLQGPEACRSASTRYLAIHCQISKDQTPKGQFSTLMRNTSECSEINIVLEFRQATLCIQL